ncbi:MAG: MBL fold metallo-hydrolase [candidate division KSB1 bacterium]|nr:MBL fold metallo-hydrolase [candidate division KSB1 bacterium]MDZ7401585.1 MBL fold metallo-hydrolase [candidate division KSB1 bacterium]
MFEVDQNGLRMSESQLYLDAMKRVELSFVSHAHSDHARRHAQVLATPATLSLMRLRHRKLSGWPVDYHQPQRMGDFSIELLPSGHVLGSAQIAIERAGTRLIYTGDFKPGKNQTAVTLEVRHADILIMESTFGAPQYVFPKEWEIIERLARFIERSFQNGIVPIVMGYALGKSQEALKILGDLNYQISIHPSIQPIVEIYEEYGIHFKNYQVYHGEDLRERVLLLPPHLSNSHLVKNIWRTRKLILTGWAVDPEAKYRYGADEALALSDHADFNQLLEFVHQVRPEKVFITHGFDSFVHHLRREGFNAELLRPTPQLSLF